MRTLADAVASAAVLLERAGVPHDEGRRDAALLARWTLGWDEALYLLRRSDAPPEDFHDRFAHAIARRQERVPVAYITGEREFYGRPFLVTPAVLIPRPETELIVDEALRAVPRRAPSGDAWRVADLGTGSGCLAVTMALEYPDARVAAIDSSAAALTIAGANARRHGVADRIDFIHGDLSQDLQGAFDLVVTNPPYVPEADRSSLAPEVGRHEPAAALFAGPDGLDVIRLLVPASMHVLAPGGWLILEFGWGQADPVAALIKRTAGLELEGVRPDLQGIPRVAVARRRPGAHAVG